MARALKKNMVFSLSLLFSIHMAHALDPFSVYTGWTAGKVAVGVGILLIKAMENTHAKDLGREKDLKENESGTVIPGMAGSYDSRIGQIMQEWQEDKAVKRREDRIYKNNMLLQGPKGNGKTTIVQKLAEQTGSKLFDFTGSDFVNKYVGTGAEKIRKIFEDAAAYVDEKGQKAMIFIDEIDRLAGGARNEGGTREYEQTEAMLWTMLEKYKDDNRIFFVGATNKPEALDGRLQDRFGSRIIEVPNPDGRQREANLKHHFYKKNGIELELICSGKCMSDLIANTAGLSNRNIEHMNDDIKEKSVFKKINPITPALIEQARKHVVASVERQKKEEEERNKPRVVRHERDTLEKTGTVAQIGFYAAMIAKTIISG